MERVVNNIAERDEDSYGFIVPNRSFTRLF